MKYSNRRDEDYLKKRYSTKRLDSVYRLSEVNWKVILICGTGFVVVLTLFLNWDKIWSAITSVLMSIAVFAGQVLVLVVVGWLLYKFIFPDRRRRRRW